MPRINRAAQFAPFDALKGLHEALYLKEQEQEKTTKAELTDEQISTLSSTVLSIENGDEIQVKYFSCGKFLSVIGKARVNLAQRYITVNSKRVVFDDIVDIKILSKENE